MAIHIATPSINRHYYDNVKKQQPMSKKYEVILEEVVRYTIIIETNTPDEAGDIAVERWNAGDTEAHDNPEGWGVDVRHIFEVTNNE